jgi:16S rRNA (guanine1207-N2)-methyltransferase
VECTRRGAELNELSNVTAELNADGRYSGSGTYDLALANPPYYSGYRIAEHFLMAGHDALRRGGELLVVTKRPEWYRENMGEWYRDVSETERKGYVVFRGTRS